jgi:hypothetical protein
MKRNLRNHASHQHGHHDDISSAALSWRSEHHES